ncbi:transposase, partial [Shigella flexneri]
WQHYRKMQRFICGVIHPGLLLQSLVMIQAGIFSARETRITA